MSNINTGSISGVMDAAAMKTGAGGNAVKRFLTSGKGNMPSHANFKAAPAASPAFSGAASGGDISLSGLFATGCRQWNDWTATVARTLFEYTPSAA